MRYPTGNVQDDIIFRSTILPVDRDTVSDSISYLCYPHREKNVLT